MEGDLIVAHSVSLNLRAVINLRDYLANFIILHKMKGKMPFPMLYNELVTHLEQKPGFRDGKNGALFPRFQSLTFDFFH